MTSQDESLDSRKLTLSKIEIALEKYSTFYEKAFFLQPRSFVRRDKQNHLEYSSSSSFEPSNGNRASDTSK